MDAMLAVREIANSRGVALRRIGLTMGKSGQYVNVLISQGSSPRCATMSKMLDVCDYALVAMPKDKVPEDAIVID